MAAPLDASALTGVFAPGSPPLMETLRTLVVTPRRTVTPGEVIRVEFAFSNLGGAAATGVRVRFANPSGAAYVEGSDTVDDAPLGRETFVANGGAPLGDLAPNTQHRVACSFRVNERIEDGSELRFQAALITDQTPVVASNAERLLVRSEPILANTSTFVTIAAGAHPKPGDLVTVRASITNTGSSSANEVLAFLPVPANTRYVPRSARVGGRAMLEGGDEPFDYGSERAVAPRLAPGQTIEIEYQATIESPLSDGARIKVIGSISSREVGEFDVQSSEIVVSSPPHFANEESGLTVFCDDIVSPGTRIPMTVRALNDGTGDAQNVSIGIELPSGIAYTPGSAHLDGQPVSDETFAGGSFSLGTLAAGRAVDAGIAGIVVMQDVEDLAIAATLRWKGPANGPGQAERRFTRTLRVRVASRFTRARNYIEIDRGVVQAREDITFTVHVFNDGTAPEPDVQLRVIPGAFLENIRIAESLEEPVPYSEQFMLGIVQPHAERTFTVQARVASPVPDRAQITLGAVLEFASGTFDLGVATVVVRSRAHVRAQACTWMREQSDALRPGQTQVLAIRFTNDGADVLRDARLDLVLPAELVLERAQNARRDGNALVFGEIAAETTHEARVAIRLVRAPRRDRILALEGTLSGRGISPVRFDPLEIPTLAQSDFAPDAQLRANPAQSIRAGERVAYEVYLRNSGDGIADHLVLRAVPSNLAVYVPGSTQLNGVMIPDDLGTSQLWSQRGLALTDVNPGVELRARWEMLIISPITAGTSIDARVVVEWDGDRSTALAAPSLRVISAPSLEAGAGGTPISVAHLTPPALETPEPDAIVPASMPHPEPESEPEPESGQPMPGADLVVPQYQPALIMSEPLAAASEPAEAWLEATFTEPVIEAHGAEHIVHGPQEEPVDEREPSDEEAATAPTLYVDFTHEQIAQTIRALEKGDAGGLVPHIVAIGALLPNSLAGADARTAQTVENGVRAIRAPLERFFVRLRMPRLTITAKDLEDRDSRFALRALAEAVIEASPLSLGERPAGAVRFSGAVDTVALRNRLPELESAPLGSVVPWILYTQLLGTSVEYDPSASSPRGMGRSDVLGLYRDELAKVFSVLETLPMPEFHRVLTSSVNRTLDDALGAVLDALRASAYSLH